VFVTSYVTGSSGDTNVEYGPLAGYTTNDHEAYIVKLGGAVLTGGGDYSYTITGTLADGSDSKVVLSSMPTAGYELEVRAISVGAATSTLEGVLVAPIREAVATGTAVIPSTANLDLRNQQVYLYSGEATSDFTINLRGDGSNLLGDTLAIGNSIGASVIVNMGTSLKAITAVQIDGTTQAVKWQGSSKTLSANKLNVISLVVVKTATDTYTVIGSVSAAGTV
jgi:hypothetical protein